MPLLNRRGFIIGAAALSTYVVADRSWGQTTQGPFKLPPLPYPANSLEPNIDARTMELHHDRHHASYVNKLNEALRDHEKLAKRPLEEIVANLNDVPESIRTTVRNNAGGHANHSMFWEVMGPDGGKPEGDLQAAIERDFGGLNQLQQRFNNAGLSVFGSGWVFVTVDPDGRLAITTRPNQDTPLMDGQRVLFGNDVWEHAYYLKYQNRRDEYLKNWWNVVNWKAVGDRYNRARSGNLGI
nr:MAG: superoxide dismutase [Pseudomonadota bacterium]